MKLIATLAVAGSTWVGFTLADEAKIQIDHIIWAVPDLDAGARTFEEMSGVKPIVGGVHPGRGTRNRLASAGDNMYFSFLLPSIGSIHLIRPRRLPRARSSKA